MHHFKDAAIEPVAATAGLGTQFSCLLARRARGQRRDLLPLAIGTFIGVALTTIFGLLFMNTARRDDRRVDAFYSHVGSVVFVVISAQQGAGNVALIKLPLERPVFLREYRNNTYSYGCYFAVSLLADWPIVFLQECVKDAILHALMGLDGALAVFVLVTFLLSVAIASMAAMLSASLGGVEAATACMPVVLIPQMLFTGVFVRVDQIPRVLRWIRHLCVLKYAIGAEIQNELSCRGSTICRDWIADNDFRDLSMWENVAVMCAFVVAAQLAGAFFLKRSIAL